MDKLVEFCQGSTLKLTPLFDCVRILHGGPTYPVLLVSGTLKAKLTALSWMLGRYGLVPLILIQAVSTQALVYELFIQEEIIYNRNILSLSQTCVLYLSN